MTKGLGAFVSPKHNYAIYGVIDPSGSSKNDLKDNIRGRALKQVGYEDSVYNHISLIKMINEENDFDTIQLEKKQANMLNRRYFTVKSIENMESLTINFAELDT